MEAFTDRWFIVVISKTCIGIIANLKNLIGRGGKSSNIAEISINENVYSDPKHIAKPLNDYFVNIGLTIASQSECLPDFDDSHSNLTDVNSKFYFHMIAEADIEKTLKNLKVSKVTGVTGLLGLPG